MLMFSLERCFAVAIYKQLHVHKLLATRLNFAALLKTLPLTKELKAISGKIQQFIFTKSGGVFGVR